MLLGEQREKREDSKGNTKIPQVVDHFLVSYKHSEWVQAYLMLLKGIQLGSVPWNSDIMTINMSSPSIKLQLVKMYPLFF